MNTETSPVVVYVAYQGAAQDRFDRDYYVEAQMPLVLRAWTPYGLLSLSAFFPVDEGVLNAPFASPELSAVMADVPRFINTTPQRARAAAL